MKDVLRSGVVFQSFFFFLLESSSRPTTENGEDCALSIGLITNKDSYYNKFPQLS